MDLLRLGTKNVEPFPFVSRAYILDTLGADEAALNELKASLCVEPAYAPAFTMMGKIYNDRKDYKKAFEYYRLGALYVPGDLEARTGLAQAYENLKDYAGAISQYQRVIDASPKNVQGYFGLARTYAEAGQYQKADDMITGAKKMGLEDKVDVQKIHDIINDHKKKQGVFKRPLSKQKVI
jgi:tetratricopeptide (TPR) repeat protein